VTKWIGGFKKPVIALPYSLPDYFTDEAPTHVITWTAG